MIKREEFHTQCEDGVSLKGLLLIPPDPKAVIQFNGGTAVKKEYYLPFLLFLAENGYLCCLWDYRGSGASRPNSLKGCDYTFRDYGLQDMPAIKKYLQSRFGGLPLLLCTHSAGGQQVGMMDKLEDYKCMLAFAVSTGDFNNMPWLYRMQAYYFFYLFAPLSNFLFGYLKAKAFGYMEDLPRQVVLEWRDWCASKDYFFDKKFADKTVPVKNFRSLPFPIHIFWAPDDPISNENNTMNFWRHVRSEKNISFQKLEPAAFGQKKIEHLGFFNKKMKESFWPLTLNKLEEFLAVKDPD